MGIASRIHKKHVYIITGVVTAVTVMAVIMTYGGKKTAGATPEYTYSTYVEAKLADDVSWYLSGVDAISSEAREEIADYSVQNYNAVIRSGTAAVTDEHSEALTKMFQDKLEGYVSDRLTGEELYALSSGISSYVWQAVLLSLNDYKESSDMTPDHDTEYMELAKSLQAQINDLENKRMNIHITARLKDDGSDGGGGASEEEYRSEIQKYIGGAYESISSNVDEKIDGDIDRKLDGMKDNIRSELEKELEDNLKNSMKDGITSELEDSLKDSLRSELEKELKNSISDGKDGKEGKEGKDGEDGKDGRDGKDGENGKDGEDGKDGENGKSTYVAYADDASGSGFLLTPTETSRYIGTCITTADSQPSDVSEYGNWQIYRNYIITSATDENGSTTLYIR